MASCSFSEPTISDVMKCLVAMSDRFAVVEKKLRVLDVLEQKVSSFEKELKSIGVAIDDRAKIM
ncbi:hypothetical protein DPMN_057998 [Dreissena polymorpha]|uniref:Uncharacterized protein n=1 Tax=Dreissena polymorpha TaxID=45954 RepID=A0A9D4HCZ0_DREPO|nr:hypothetical protein DPMN_057998 [Dreissena polymorpha]